MNTKATVYYQTRTEGGRREKHVIHYDHVSGMRAGTALQLLGDDAAGNGLRNNAPLIQLLFDDGTTATFDADNVTVLF